jgi:hypothetical protein
LLALHPDLESGDGLAKAAEALVKAAQTHTNTASEKDWNDTKSSLFSKLNSIDTHLRQTKEANESEWSGSKSELMDKLDSVNTNLIKLDTHSTEDIKLRRIDFAIDHLRDYCQTVGSKTEEVTLKKILYFFRQDYGYWVPTTDRYGHISKDNHTIIQNDLDGLLGVTPRLEKESNNGTMQWCIYYS